MPLSADQCLACRQVPLASKATGLSRGFWPSIIRTFVLQVVLLFALAGAAVFYVNWSSEAAFTEFLAASKTAAASGSPLSAIKAQPCDRGA